VLALPRINVDGRERPIDFLARLATGRHLGYPVRSKPNSRNP
jgi:hypothetical protein